MQTIQFGYFHGMEAEQYSFYRIPKMLFTAECFKGLSCEAKVLYGLMLDRMGLSIKNRWFDDDDRVYIVFTVEEIGELMGCGVQKVIKLMKELDTDKGIGLIEKKRLGLGKPNVIYVKNFMLKEESHQPDKEGYDADTWEGVESETETDICQDTEAQFLNDENHNSGIAGTTCKETHKACKIYIQEVLETAGRAPAGLKSQNCENHNSRIVKITNQELPKSKFKNDENHSSRIVKTTIQEFPKSQSNNTEFNNTNFNETNPINPYPSGKIDRMDRYRDAIRENISYGYFLNDSGCSKEELDELVELIVDVMMMPDRAFLRIAGAERSVEVVKERFMKLEHDHIAYVLGCLRKNTSKVGNIRSYLLTSLYNATLTIGNYYRAEANYDMYGSG